MAKWQQTLNIKDVWSAKLPIPELAKVVSERLAGLSRIGDEYLDDIRLELADEFRYLSDDKDATTEEFNDIMRRLYDWADTPLDDHWNGRKMCWVKTF